jgi:hypothetical protein
MKNLFFNFSSEICENDLFDLLKVKIKEIFSLLIFLGDKNEKFRR